MKKSKEKEKEDVVKKIVPGKVKIKCMKDQGVGILVKRYL